MQPSLAILRNSALFSHLADVKSVAGLKMRCPDYFDSPVQQTVGSKRGLGLCLPQESQEEEEDRDELRGLRRASWNPCAYSPMSSPISLHNTFLMGRGHAEVMPRAYWQDVHDGCEDYELVRQPLAQ